MRYLFNSLVISVLMLIMGGFSTTAKQSGDTLRIYFPQGVSTFDRELRDNGERFDDFVAKIQLTQKLSQLKVISLEKGGFASDASMSDVRASVISEMLAKNLDFRGSSSSLITDWESLTKLVKEDKSVPARKEAMKILANAESEREAELRSLNDGQTWDYLLRTQLPDLRSFVVFICTDGEQPVCEGNVKVSLASVSESQLAAAPAAKPEAKPAIKPEAKQLETKQPKAAAKSEAKQPKAKAAAKPETKQPEAKAADEQKPVAPKAAAENDWSRKLTIKTNLLGDAFLMANAAVEVDIIENLAFALPIYWSGWDYAGNHSLKFRTFMIQPEIRYYIPKTNGLYVGAHFGIGHWNFALGNLAPKLGLDELDGWRYQDHKGENPAMGGGLSLGYALQFKKNPRWGMEFAVGAGVYDAKYDVFYNEANGPYHERGVRTTYIGVDNASISFTYKFDLSRSSKKEGRR